MMVLTKSQKLLLASLVVCATGAVVGTVWWMRIHAPESDIENAFFSGDGTDQQYIDINGVAVDISENISTVTIVTVWASWSPYSRDELPLLDTLAAEYKDKNVSFVVLNRKESKEQAQRFLATLPPLSNVKVVIDTADTFYTAVAGYAMPETLVYNAKGEVIDHVRAVLTEDTARAAIEAALTSS